MKKVFQGPVSWKHPDDGPKAVISRGLYDRRGKGTVNKGDMTRSTSGGSRHHRESLERENQHQCVHGLCACPAGSYGLVCPSLKGGDKEEARQLKAGMSQTGADAFTPSLEEHSWKVSQPPNPHALPSCVGPPAF